MSGFSPTTPIAFQIRKIIFEKFNDINVNFTNDDVFEILKQNGNVDPSWTIDDAEPFFHEICDSGLVRNIGQNFTTMYLKLFDLIEKVNLQPLSVKRLHQLEPSNAPLFINPMELKRALAARIVEDFHGARASREAAPSRS